LPERLVDRRTSPGLWRATAASIGILIVAEFDLLMGVVGEIGSLITDWDPLARGQAEPWWWMSGSQAEFWRKYAGAVCGVLVLLVIWAYLRKLRAAMIQARAEGVILQAGAGR
jgi:hypothetical protein